MKLDSKIKPLAPSQDSAHEETILVVDDHPALCHVASLLLRRFGYNVLTAHTGEQARCVARTGVNIDLLLTDVEMPGMSGPELAAWFGVTRPQVQVVFMSGNPAQLEALKPRPGVEKPFIHLDRLVGTIREVLTHRRSTPPAITAAA